jgi:hypothetical protein
MWDRWPDDDVLGAKLSMMSMFWKTASARPAYHWSPRAGSRAVDAEAFVSHCWKKFQPRRVPGGGRPCGATAMRRMPSYAFDSAKSMIRDCRAAGGFARFS